MILYTDLVKNLKNMLHNKQSSIYDLRTLVNNAVTQMNSEIDVRSSKRISSAPYAVYQDIYSYYYPTDAKDGGIIDVQKQVNPYDEEWDWITVDEFKKNPRTNTFALQTNQNGSTLLINANQDTDSLTLEDCSSIGNWVASDKASSLAVDTDNYINGSSSFQFSISAGAGTAILTNSSLTSADISEYADTYPIFLWVYIPSATGLTSFKLDFGNDSSNYFTKTVTTTQEGLAFHTGWNLLSFSSPTEVGTVTNTAVDYVVLTITVGASFSSTTTFRMDYLVISQGDLYESVYYSTYPWKNNAGSYIAESTTDTDYLMFDDGEVVVLRDLINSLAAASLREPQDLALYRADYAKKKESYQASTPSEAKKLSTYISHYPDGITD